MYGTKENTAGPYKDRLDEKAKKKELQNFCKGRTKYIKIKPNNT